MAKRWKTGLGQEVAFIAIGLLGIGAKAIPMTILSRTPVDNLRQDASNEFTQFLLPVGRYAGASALHKFGILWLFGLTLHIAILLAVANWSFPIAYLGACLTLPVLFAYVVRFVLQFSMDAAMKTAIGASIVIGSALLVLLSIHRSNPESSSGFLAGNSFDSIISAFVVGGLLGGFTGLLSGGIFFLIAETSTVKRDQGD